MTATNIPIRIASRRTIAQLDLESVYAEIVKVVGGTYYNNGIAVGPVAGKLDWRNFTPNAGISNSNKLYDRSTFAIQMMVDDYYDAGNPATSKHYYLPVPVINIAANQTWGPFGGKIIPYGWSLVCSGASIANGGGLPTLRHYANGSLEWTDLGILSGNIPNPGGTGLFEIYSGNIVAGKPLDTSLNSWFDLEFLVNTVDCKVYNLVLTIWCTARHVAR